MANMELKKELRHELYVRTVAKVIIIFGSALWLTKGIFKYDILNSLLSDKLEQMVQLAIGLSGIYLSVQLDFWLPFLGPAALPPTIINNSVSDIVEITTKTETIKVDNRATKVVVWYANVKDSKSYLEAYGDWDTAKVYDIPPQAEKATTDTPKSESVMTIPLLQEPVGYMGLNPHIHYRFIYPNGILSKIHTLQRKNEPENKEAK